MLVVGGRPSSTADAGSPQALAFVVRSLLGGVMIYCFWLMLATSAFWLVRMDEIHELFEGLYQAGQ